MTTSNVTTSEPKSIWFYVIALANILHGVRREGLGTTPIHDSRRSIRELLRQSHEFLLEKTSERNAYFVLFALVALTDESMEEYVQKNPSDSWLPLQTELFEITNAGTLFYQYVDYFRGRNDIPVIIYEIFYFCLKDGFKGSKINEPDLRTAYLKELKVHIPVENIPSLSDRPVSIDTAKRRVPVLAYYLAAFLIVSFFRFLLELIPLDVNI